MKLIELINQSNVIYLPTVVSGIELLFIVRLFRSHKLEGQSLLMLPNNYNKDFKQKENLVLDRNYYQGKNISDFLADIRSKVSKDNYRLFIIGDFEMWPKVKEATDLFISVSQDTWEEKFYEELEIKVIKTPFTQSKRFFEKVNVKHNDWFEFGRAIGSQNQIREQKQNETINKKLTELETK